MADVSALRLTGSNNPNKQASKDWSDDLLDKIERGVPVTLQDFGAVADNATDCLAAWNLAMAFLATVSTLPLSGTSYRGSPKLFVPAGRYYFSGTLEIKVSVIVEGEGASNTRNAGAATEFRFPAATTGIRINTNNTLGGVAASITTGGDCSAIRDIFVRGPSSGSGDYDAIRLHARATIERCSTNGFARAGIAVIAAAGSGGATEGNANCWQVYGGRHEYHKVAGIYVEGADANAGFCIGADLSFNGQYGIYDNSFLGNTYMGCHTEYNGTGISGYEGTTNNPSSICFNNGHLFTVMPGQAVGASTNTPPSTATSNTYWGYFQSVGAAATQYPQWASGMSVAEGGAYYMESIVAGNLLLGCYVEGSQSPTKGFGPALAIGGAHTGGVFGTLRLLQNGSNGVVQLGPFAESAFVSATGTSTVRLGAAADRFLTLTAEDGSTYFIELAGGYLKFRDGNGAQPIAINYSNGRHNVLDTEAGGYKVTGTKVVGAQGAAVADATDPASTMARLNDLLARLRTHGLIAT